MTVKVNPHPSPEQLISMASEIKTIVEAMNTWSTAYPDAFDRPEIVSMVFRARVQLSECQGVLERKVKRMANEHRERALRARGRG